MRENMDNHSQDTMLKNLEDKLDAFIQKGFLLGRELPIEERNTLIKNIINELVDNVVSGLRESKDIDITDDELVRREKLVKKFAENYYIKKLQLNQER